MLAFIDDTHVVRLFDAAWRSVTSGCSASSHGARDPSFFARQVRPADRFTARAAVVPGSAAVGLSAHGPGDCCAGSSCAAGACAPSGSPATRVTLGPSAPAPAGAHPQLLVSATPDGTVGLYASGDGRAFTAIDAGPPPRAPGRPRAWPSAAAGTGRRRSTRCAWSRGRAESVPLTMPTTAVVWFRRDLRVHDHPALAEACRAFDRVVPLFVFDDRLLRGRFRSLNRTAWMLGCLEALDGELRERGGRLVVRHGAPPTEVRRVARETGATRGLRVRRRHRLRPRARRRGRARPGPRRRRAPPPARALHRRPAGDRSPSRAGPTPSSRRSCAPGARRSAGRSSARPRRSRCRGSPPDGCRR